MRPPFDRTTCDCSECVACCHRYPGHLIPSDLERIAEYLNLSVESAKSFFWASRGAKVLHNGIIKHIGTITPKFDQQRQACIFLTEDNRCRIHEVAPFGCAYADTHMSLAVWRHRGTWALQQIMESKEYAEQRSAMPPATCHNPLTT
jgi:Fe-S-cluster containining protein